MDHTAPHSPSAGAPPANPERGLHLKRLAKRVHKLLTAGHSALDPQLLQALAELADHAQDIVRLACEHASLLDILRDLQAHGQFGTTAAPSDGALAAARQRARRAADRRPTALWDPHAEREMLERLLHACDAHALDGILLDLAQATGYLGLIDVSWGFWHYGRHAEQAQALGMDGALHRLLSAGWQIQHRVLEAPGSEQAERERAAIRARHCPASAPDAEANA
ncbi:hypothetical protein DelCs14_1736 [Delftia sp. Cs1-4]|uniref:hypothetical protein n=1 Tax=Delftia sp. (strain Cs1-4) TaxID=742013 RepID=UPI00020E7AEF|nr:hypothetical protein [Delftia sp. Cs1-4]AEF88765.1 hypothetical protein DelCs14_1736 [Delftia sp. Cs1-4]